MAGPDTRVNDLEEELTWGQRSEKTRERQRDRDRAKGEREDRHERVGRIPVRGLKMKMAPLMGFVVKLPTRNQ